MLSCSPLLMNDCYYSDDEDLLLRPPLAKHNNNHQQQPALSSWEEEDEDEDEDEAEARKVAEEEELLLLELENSTIEDMPDMLTDDDMPELAHSDAHSYCSTLSLCSAAHSSASSLTTAHSASVYSVAGFDNLYDFNRNLDATPPANVPESIPNTLSDATLFSKFDFNGLSRLDSYFNHLLKSCYKKLPQHSSPSALSVSQSIQSQFLALSHPSTLLPIINSLSETMRQSLNDSSSPTMLPSLLTSLPTGSEQGTFLSVDVGGSTLRVALISLHGRKSNATLSKSPLKKSATPLSVLLSEQHIITDSLKRSSGCDFFMWICNKIKHALEACPHVSKSSKLCMGLSWSFPFAQLQDISRGTILAMGKGYKVADQIAGWDLNDAFSQCFAKLGLNIELTAIINDTIASLVSHSYLSKDTRAALILGTGVNASAVLPISNTASGEVKRALINTELSLLGGDIIPETKWDRIIDSQVERPGFQPFETKVSGRYLGEISRLLVRDIYNGDSDSCSTFTESSNSSRDSCSSDSTFDLFEPTRQLVGFDEKYGFDTAIMSKAEGYFLQDKISKARQVLEVATGSEFSNDSEVEDLCRVFQSVSCRSAAYTAAYLVALAMNFEDKDINKEKVISIAYSGTVVEKYPLYRERCQKFLDTFTELVFGDDSDNSIRLQLEPALDGTLFGPAIASAMNC